MLILCAYLIPQNNRQRRRYERRRIRHRLKLEGKIQGRSPNWAEKLVASQEITASNAFMGNVNKDPRSGSSSISSTCVSWVDLLSRNSDCDTANLGIISEATTAPTSSTTSTLFDDEEMNEDGYWGSKYICWLFLSHYFLYVMCKLMSPLFNIYSVWSKETRICIECH